MRIGVSPTLICPLHTSLKVVQFVRVEIALIIASGVVGRLFPTCPGIRQRVRTKPELVIAAPVHLRRVFWIAETIRHHIEERRCITFHSPFVFRIFGTQSTFSLNILLVFFPILLTQVALQLPRSLIPNEFQVILKLLTQPLMRAVRPVHAHAVLHILIGDGIDAEFPDKLSHLLRSACLLHSPDSLCQCVGTTPCSHPNRALVRFVSQSNQEIASRRIIALTHHLDATTCAAHHGTSTDIFRAWPIPYPLLSILFGKRGKLLLSRTSHQMLHILLIRIHHLSQIVSPFLRIRVTIPPHCRKDAFNLKLVGISHETHS